MTSGYKGYTVRCAGAVVNKKNNVGLLLGTVHSHEKIIFVVDVIPDINQPVLSSGFHVLGNLVSTSAQPLDPNATLIAYLDSESQAIKFSSLGEALNTQIENFLPAFLSKNVIFRYSGQFKVLLQGTSGDAFDTANKELQQQLSSDNLGFSFADENSLLTFTSVLDQDIKKIARFAVSYSNKLVPSAIPIKIYFPMSTDPSPSAPAFSFTEIPGTYQEMTRTLNVDILVYASHSEDLNKVLRRVQKELLTQIDALFSVLKKHPNYPKAKIFHFSIDGFDRVLFTAYPVDPVATNEDAIVNIRRDYHNYYGIPQTRPLIRSVNAMAYTIGSSTNDKHDFKRLSNVHDGLNSPSGLGTQYLIKGTYLYYHYLQDNFNDDGWGCAYRSLQTIESWYILQNFTTKPVQTHREIQLLLYSLGQRTKAFIGSKEWIGSIEIQTVLQQYLGISSKILHLSRGTEFINHVKQIADHFTIQGTPIMIGGGKLAYTLLGIDWNPDKQKVMLLILDPHYTGKDEISTIHKKGWCGWKEISAIFKPDTFYNLCLPQVPGSTGTEQI